MERLNLKFLWPLCGLVAGILTADFFPDYSFVAGITLLAVSITVWLFFYILSRKPEQSLRIAPLHFIWIFLLFNGIGILDYYYNCPRLHLSDNQLYDISGEITERRIFANGDRFIINVKNLEDDKGLRDYPHNMKILLKTDGFNGSIGDIISFKTKLELINNEKRESKGYIDGLKHKGIVASGFVNSDGISKIAQANSVTDKINNYKESLEILIEKSSLERDAGDFLISVLLGDKSFLSPSFRQSLNSAGLSHILALSGLHVAIIISIISFLLFPLSLGGYHKTRILLIIALVWCYVAFTGFFLSAVRAAIMATLLLGSILLERRNSAFNALLFATFIILLVFPLSLWDIGLQLSFICVASILLFARRLNLVRQHHHPNLHKFVNLVLISIVTSLATWTIVIYYFKNVPLLFLPANLILVPLLPFFIGAGIIFITLLAFGFDFSPLSILINYFYKYFIELSNVLSSDGLSTVSINIPWYSVFLWLLIILLLAGALYSERTAIRRVLFASALSTTVLFTLILLINEESKNSSLVFPHSFTAMEGRLFNESGTTNFKFKRQSFSKINVGTHEILAIDCPLTQDGLENIKRKNKDGQRILMLGADADFNQISETSTLEDFDYIILHTSVGKNKKQELSDRIPAEVRKKIYSMRENGTIEIELNHTLNPSL